MSSPLAGAEMITFFAPASRCARAVGPAVNRPVDSITTSTPRSRHGSRAGSRSARIWIFLSPARMTSPDTDTPAGSVPSTVSYFSRCAMVAMSPRSFAATISKPRSPAAALTARQKLRPMRPNPLIPTRMVTAPNLLVISSRSEIIGRRPPAAAWGGRRGGGGAIPARPAPARRSQGRRCGNDAHRWASLWQRRPSVRAAAARTAGPRRLHAGPGGKPARPDGRGERGVVPLVLIGVGRGEARDGPVEGIPLAQVGGDRYPVAPPGVGPGQRRPADARVQGCSRDEQAVRVRAALPVVELAHVVVAG